MTRILEKIKAETFLYFPENGNVFALAEDGFIYLLNGGEQSYWFVQLQSIRKGLTFLEIITWEQFVLTGYSNPLGPRHGSKTFRSIKKAFEELEKGVLEWVPDMHFETDAKRQKAYEERTSEDYIPSKLRWALSKGKGESWACQKVGITSLEQPWKTKSCPLVPLRARS